MERKIIGSQDKSHYKGRSSTNHIRSISTVKSNLPIVLSIAGFDGSAGAGIQADIKTISAIGCYGINVLTSLPIQNTQKVYNTYEIPADVIFEQLKCLFDDFYPDSIKIGLIEHPSHAAVIADFLKDYSGPIIYDPVMISSSGQKLMNQDNIQAIKELIFPIIDLLTPNLDEISLLIDQEISTLAQMKASEKKVLGLGLEAALLKGGHLKEELISSILMQKNKPLKIYQTKKINTKNTHGTGCTLSSAIASYLALGSTLESAIEKAILFVDKAIREAVNFNIGLGNGPLNHFFSPNKLKIKND